MGTVYPGYQQREEMQVFDSYAPAPDLTPGMNPYGMLPDGNWGQWWSPGDAAFAESANATAPNVYPQEQQFHPNYTFDQAAPTDDSPATSIHSYPVPSPSTEATSVGASPGDDSRRGSQPDQRKRKRNTATTTKSKAEPRPPATRSTRRASAKNASKAEPAPPAERPKRGSRSKASAKQIKQEAEALEEEAQDAEEQYDEHNKKVQERNRIASNKFRVKKREDALKLRADEEDMERVNRDLSNCVSDLTLQVYDLKMKLLQHTDCKCHLIQNYIATEAQKYIKDLGDGKHPNTTPALPPPHMFLQQHHHAQ